MFIFYKTLQIFVAICLKPILKEVQLCVILHLDSSFYAFVTCLSSSTDNSCNSLYDTVNVFKI